MNLQHLSRSIAWVMAGQLAAVLGQLVGIRLLTELVPPAAFGRFNLLLGVSALLLVVLGTPLMLALQRFYSTSTQKSSLHVLRGTVLAMLWRRIVMSGGLIALLVLGLLITGLPGIVALVLLAALLAIEVLRGFEMTFLNAAHEHRKYSVWQAADACLRPTLAILLIRAFEPSAEILLAGYVLGGATCYFGARLLIGLDSSQYDRRIRYSSELRREINRYALPLVPFGLVSWVSSVADRYVIGTMLTLDQVGMYSATYGLASRPTLILSEIADMVIRPRYYEAVASRNRLLERRYLAVWCGFIVGSVAPLLVGVAVFHSVIGRILLGEAYRAATHLMPWCGRCQL